MIRILRAIIEDTRLDPLTRIERCFDQMGREDSRIRWIGLYLITHSRKEYLLGPFFGPPRKPVRFPLQEGFPDGSLARYLDDPQDLNLWFTQREGDSSDLHDCRVVSVFLKRAGKVLGQLEMVGTLEPEDCHLLETLGTLIEPFIPDFDLDDPFS